MADWMKYVWLIEIRLIEWNKADWMKYGGLNEILLIEWNKTALTRIWLIELNMATDELIIPVVVVGRAWRVIASNKPAILKELRDHIRI